MFFSRGYVVQADVEKRFGEGNIFDYKIEKNMTMVVWDWHGWKIVETSACVDENNYSHELGKKICIEKIKDRIWKMLGYELHLYNLGMM